MSATLYIVLVRPVGSSCWTTERISGSRDGAEKYAAEERNKKIRFADGSLHLQSTAIIAAILPSNVDLAQQHYEAANVADTKLSIP